MDLIYLDHAATSPLRPEAWSEMSRLVGEADYNPASSHSAGGRAAEVLESARAELAGLLGAERGAVIFTGGGTQSDSLAVLGFARANAGSEPRVMVSATEHKAVLESARRAAVEGARLVVLPVDSAGRVAPESLADRLAEDAGRPTLVSVMWANNEVGVVQPVMELCQVSRQHGALFHTDAVQAFGKLPVSLARVPADLLTITSHKLGGPVGIGALYVRPDLELEPLAYGGSQERSLRPGTQNALGARGFSTAARLAAQELPTAAPRWRAMRDELESYLRSEIPELSVHGDAAERLPNVLSVGVPDCDQASLLVSLDLAGVAVSGGSACASGAGTGSHVLEAMGIGRGEPYAVVRFSFGPTTDASEVRRAAEITARAARTSRDRSR